eukprot:1160227-Pelagomonas_calceolata.AAC.4
MNFRQQGAKGTVPRMPGHDTPALINFRQQGAKGVAPRMPGQGIHRHTDTHTHTHTHTRVHTHILRARGHSQDDKVQREGQGDGHQQVGVAPGGHLEERVVLAEGVEGVEHFDGHQHRQRQRHGLGLTGL